MRHKNKKGIKKRGSRKPLAFGFLLFILTIMILHTIRSFSQSSIKSSQVSTLNAAIVDQLSLSHPNQTFVQKSTNILEASGFTVDYYEGEEVTVDFYRNLPTQDYGLIIFRVHSALRANTMGPPVGLFTSESYTKTKYLYEQLTDQVVRASFFEAGVPKEPYYFGIQPEFVRQSMRGKFQRTIIIVMGCNGLTYPYMAEAFIKKGASAYISWSNYVLASQTDLAITRLLQHFIVETQTLQEAMRETFEEVGPDPSYNSLLTYYPLEAGTYTAQSILRDPTPI